MKAVLLENVEPGVTLGRAVFSVEGRMLLSRGVVLQAPLVEKLRQAGVRVVYIAEEGDEEAQQTNIISEGARLSALRAVHNALTRAAAVRPRTRLVLNDAELEEAADGLMDELVNNRRQLVTLVDPGAYDDHLAGHSVNVCILALLTGIGMNYNVFKLKQLALGALLHDLGMAALPAALWRKAGELTAEERRLVEAHPRNGFKMLQGGGQFNATALAVVLQHEERFDGTGYPKRLRGADIHEFARITAVADVYDALTEHQPDQPGCPPHEAMRMIAEGRGAAFDPAIADQLLKHIAPYPLGESVRLSNGWCGRVVAVGQNGQPLPTVHVTSSSGEPSPRSAREVNLAEHPELRVEEVLSD